LLIVVFSVIALVLVLAGLYGVIVQSVSQRKREIAIRSALGAPQREIQQMFIRDGLKLAVAGIVAGVSAAATLTPLIGSVLFGVTPLDSVTYTAVALLLLGVASVASYLPARRAARVDPLVALRYE
jgi:putative ABC transport system permease protein